MHSPWQETKTMSLAIIHLGGPFHDTLRAHPGISADTPEGTIIDEPYTKWALYMKNAIWQEIPKQRHARYEIVRYKTTDEGEGWTLLALYKGDQRAQTPQNAEN
jgi:hypothetical protein